MRSNCPTRKWHTKCTYVFLFDMLDLITKTLEISSLEISSPDTSSWKISSSEMSSSDIAFPKISSSEKSSSDISLYKISSSEMSNVLLRNSYQDYSVFSNNLPIIGSYAVFLWKGICIKLSIIFKTLELPCQYLITT